MSDRKLHQVGWAQGITEGDIGKHTTAELLNAEIDRPGMLRPRDELIEATNNAAPFAFDVAYMTSPLDSDSVIVVYLGTSGLIITGGGIDDTLSFGKTLTEASQMVIRNGVIYISVITSGGPQGVYTVLYQKADTRFSPPRYFELHSDENEQAVTAGWVLQSPEKLAPEMTAIEIDDSTFITDADTALLVEPEKAVVIGYGRVAEFQEQGLSFTDTAGMEIATQFVYTDDQVGPVSNTESFSFKRPENGDDLFTFGVGFSLAVSTSISSSVKAVNVFRRVLFVDGTDYPNSKLELLFTAYLLEDDISNQLVNATEAHAAINSRSAETVEDAGPPEILNYGVTGWGQYKPLDSTVNRTLDGEAAFVSGWLEYSSGSMFYWSPVMASSGQFDLDISPDDFPDNYYTVVLPSARILYDYFSGAGSNVAISGLTPAIHGEHLNPGSGSFGPMYIDHEDTHEGFGLDIGVHVVHMLMSGAVTGEYSSTSYSDTITPVVYRSPIVQFLDLGQPGIMDIDDVIGTDEESISTVKPRIITYAAGRILGLNVDQDDELKPARLTYTQFRKYGTWDKANYVDFSPRDDGVGVALASFRNRLLVLQSTSTYIIDLSGGSDLSWRELGAFSDVNCISRDAVIETPIGVFFGGTFHAYLFDGQNIHKITELPHTNIRDKYRAMAVGSPRFTWRSDMRQLWIIEGTDVLVFDADSKAWHTHSLDELSVEQILGFVNIANAEYLVTLVNTGLAVDAVTYSFDGTELDRPFDWGMDTGEVNMGSSEFIKKLKRVYIDTDGEQTDPTTDLTLTVAGEDESFTPLPGRKVSRISTSERGYMVRVALMAMKGAGRSWAGKIESLGMSYKPKKLK